MLALVSAAGFMLLGPPLTGPGIAWSIRAEELEKVSALAFGDDGALFAVLESGRGHGELIRLSATGKEVLLGGLSKPDGLLFQGDTLFITNESGLFGLTAWQAGATRQYDRVQQAEGIAASATGGLLVIEDRKLDGRLIRVDPASGEVEELLTGLAEAEGVCESPDGAIWIVEKSATHLSRVVKGIVQPVIGGLVKPAFLNCRDDGSILITEDRTNFGRLLRYRHGELEVLARNLRAPQGAVFGADGALYLAEQNRNRVLRLDGI
jgi:sugar lactone lactonase YvrE